MFQYCFSHGKDHYMGDFKDHVLPATVEQIRTVLGEAALNEMRKHPGEVITVQIKRTKVDISLILNGMK